VRWWTARTGSALRASASQQETTNGQQQYDDRRQRQITGASVLLGLLGIMLGVYSLLTDAMAFPVAAGALAFGVLLATGAMAVGRQRVSRTRYRPDPWALPEWLVIGSGALAAATLIVAAARGVEGLILPGPLVVPPVPLLPVLGILIGLAPAVAAPPLTRRRELVPA
jgi:energy-coupling factor transport system permease protein